MKSYCGHAIENNKLDGWDLNSPLENWKGLYDDAFKTGEIELAEIFDYLLTRIYLAEKENLKLKGMVIK